MASKDGPEHPMKQYILFYCDITAHNLPSILVLYNEDPYRRCFVRPPVTLYMLTYILWFQLRNFVRPQTILVPLSKEERRETGYFTKWQPHQNTEFNNDWENCCSAMVISSFSINIRIICSVNNSDFNYKKTQDFCVTALDRCIYLCPTV